MKGQAPHGSPDPSLEFLEAEVTSQVERHHLQFLGTFPTLSTLAISRRPAAISLVALNQSVYKASQSTILVRAFPPFFENLCLGLSFWHSHQTSSFVRV